MKDINFRFYDKKKKRYDYFTLDNIKTYQDIFDKHLLSGKQPELFTGLKDKNEVKIFEGDILRILYTDWPSNTDSTISLEEYKKSISHYGVVVYSGYSFNMMSLNKNRFESYFRMSLNHGRYGEFEITGNIHEDKKDKEQ